MFGCDESLSRKRSVVRDDRLRASLAVLAPTPQHQWAWVRGDEVRLSPPDVDDEHAWAGPLGQAGSSANALSHKWQRLTAGVESLAAPSAGKRRASEQHPHGPAAAAKHPRLPAALVSGGGVAVKSEAEGMVHGAECQAAEEDSDVYEVERILGERRRGGRAQFLIRWLG